MASNLISNADLEAAINSGLPETVLDIYANDADALIREHYGDVDSFDLSEIARRKAVLVELVLIATRYGGVSHESIGPVSYSMRIDEERRKVLTRLNRSPVG